MKLGILVLLALVLGIPMSASSAVEEPSSKKAKPDAKPATVQKATQKVKDPVCGMEIDTKSAAGKAPYKGKTYYFCSANEKEEFERNPAKYVK